MAKNKATYTKKKKKIKKHKKKSIHKKVEKQGNVSYFFWISLMWCSAWTLTLLYKSASCTPFWIISSNFLKGCLPRINKWHSLPNSANTCANSTAMYPAPTTPTFFGKWSNLLKKSSLVIAYSPPFFMFFALFFYFFWVLKINFCFVFLLWVCRLVTSLKPQISQELWKSQKQNHIKQTKKKQNKKIKNINKKTKLGF